MNLILDLSKKHKIDYINYFNKNNKSDNISFNNLINETNSHTIPDTINIIYLNYIYVINMFKKEMNFLINKLNKEKEFIINNDSILQLVINNVSI